MNVFIRVDASVKIGTGHVMRCLTLALGIKPYVKQICFISRGLPGYLTSLLHTSGLEIASMSGSIEGINGSTNYADWLGTSQQSDADETVALIKDRNCDLLVVDHYALDNFWEDQMLSYTNKLFVIDDLANRTHTTNYLLDQNLYPDSGERYSSLVSKKCVKFLGPSYALLRSEFHFERSKVINRTGKIKKILVSMGGIDAFNITEIVIAALVECKLNIQADIVIGFDHPVKDKIIKLCMQFNYQLHIQTTRIAKLMASADLAIGSSGSTSWERCFLGLPTICITQAANQVPIALGLEQAEVIHHLGGHGNLTKEEIKKAILTLHCNPEKIKRMSEACFNLVDGKGIERISNKIFF